VKDIGTGYVTFLINPEQPDNQPKRPSEERKLAVGLTAEREAELLKLLSAKKG